MQAGSPDYRLRSVEPGTPDLLVIYPQFFFLEVKVPGKELSEKQALWHFRAARAGVRVFTVHSVAEALRALKEVRNGN